MLRKTAAFAFVTFLVCINPGHAVAAQRDMTVSYADLDLSRPAGAETLLTRIQRAARTVCGGHPDIRDLTMSERYNACRLAAVENAIRSINNPLLTRLYEARPLQKFAEWN